MTCVMIWRNREPNQDDIWASADTRVSGGREGNSIYTDEALKILSIPVRCFRPPPGGGMFTEKCYEGSIGLAFAGNTLIGHSTVLAVAPLLAQLCTLGALPSLEEIATFVSQFLSRYTNSVNWFSVAGDRKVAEIAVFGRSPRDGALSVFTISPSLEGEVFALVVQEFDLTPLDSLLLLGDQKEEVSFRVTAARSRYHFGELPWWRAPREAMRELIDDEDFPTIGGAEQLGMTRGNSFDLYIPVMPVVKGEPYSTMKYLGVEIPPQGWIDPCFVGLTGMA